MNRPFVSVMIGSDSDLPVIQSTLGVLEALDVPYEVKITSPHRTPEQTYAYVKDADGRGCAVFLAASGLAVHLAGTVAALTIKPVIGIPMESGPFKGIDALLSTVQMPGGVPVASMAVGKSGATNAAYLAAQILALGDELLAERIRAERAANAEGVRDKDARLQAELKAR